MYSFMLGSLVNESEELVTAFLLIAHDFSFLCPDGLSMSQNTMKGKNESIQIQRGWRRPGNRGGMWSENIWEDFIN